MKVLVLSTDINLFKPQSRVAKRISELSLIAEEIHIVVYTRTGFRPTSIAKNIFLYPTNTTFQAFYFLDFLKVIKPLLSKKFDLVSAQESMAGLIAWILKKLYKIKFELQIHGDFASPYFTKGNYKNILHKIGFKFLIHKADGIRVVSDRIKQSLLRAGVDDKRITILPVYSDVRVFRDVSPSFSLSKRFSQFNFLFLTVCRLEPEKNMPIIFRSFAEVVKKFPKSGLIVVGDGQLRKELETLAKNLQISKNVIFEGWQEELISYYKGTNLLLNASNFEGFGVNLVEAAISGCPILTTDVGLVGSLLDEKSALICPVNNQKCFTDKMLLAINNPKLLAINVFNAHQSVEGGIIKTKEDYITAYKNAWRKAAGT